MNCFANNKTQSNASISSVKTSTNTMNTNQSVNGSNFVQNNINVNNHQETQQPSLFKAITLDQAKMLDIKKVAKVVSATITDIIQGNDNPKNYEMIKRQTRSLFFSKIVPEISAEAYLLRVLKYTRLETSTLILMSVYIDSFCEINGFFLTKNNVFRVMIAAALVAIKFNEDKIYCDSHYAKVGGISNEEIIALEFSFLNGLDYNLFVDEETYSLLHEYLVTEIMKYEKEEIKKNISNESNDNLTTNNFNSHNNLGTNC